MKKFLGLLALLGALGYLGFSIYQRATADTQTGGPPSGRGGGGSTPVPVNIAPVQRTTILDLSQYSGSLAANAQFNVSPKVIGRLERILIDIGDEVRNGQLIAELDDAEYSLSVEQAEAELTVAQANVQEAETALEIANRELQRQLSLREQRVASESEVDAARADQSAREARLKVAQAQVLQRESELRSAQVRLSYTKIHATWEAGEGDDIRYVAERFVDQGALLTSNSPIVEIVDLDPLTAVINVVERDYSQIRIGQEVQLTTDAYPDKIFSGTVERVAPVLKEEVRQARVEVRAPNPDTLLKPGMFVRATIEFGRHENTQAAPFAALVEREGRRGVFVVDQKGMQAQFVPVQIGFIQGELAEIIEPVLTGPVVTLGQHLLEDGSTVILPGAESESDSPPLGRGGPGQRGGGGPSQMGGRP